MINSFIRPSSYFGHTDESAPDTSCIVSYMHSPVIVTLFDANTFTAGKWKKIHATKTHFNFHFGVDFADLVVG